MKFLGNKTINILFILVLLGVAGFFAFYRLDTFPQDIDGEMALYGDTIILLNQAREEHRPAPEVFREAYHSWVRRLILSYSPQLEIFAFSSPLWTVILYLSYKCLGISVFATLLPSALTAIGLVLITYLFAKTLYSRTAGLLAGLLLSSSLFFNLTIRAGYGFEQFTPLLSIIVIYLFYRAHQEGKKKYLWLSGLFAGLAWMGSFSSAFLVPFILAGFVFWRWVSRKKIVSKEGADYKIKDYLKAGGIALGVGLGLSILISLYFKAPPFANFYWVHKQWVTSKILGTYSLHQYAPQGISGLADNFGTFFRNMFLAMSPEGLTHYGQQFEGKPMIPYLVSLFFILGLFYSIYRRRTADKLCLFWLGVNFVIFSLIITFQPRYMFLALPVVYIIAARGMVSLGAVLNPRKVIFAGVFVPVLVLLLGLNVYSGYHNFFIDFAGKDSGMTRYHGQKQVAEFVMSGSSPEDCLVVMDDSLFNSHTNFFFYTGGASYKVVFWTERLKDLRLIARKGEVDFENYYADWLKAWEKGVLDEKKKIFYMFSVRPFFYYETIGLGRDDEDLLNWSKRIFLELHPGIEPVKEIKFTNGDPALVIYEVY